jgi:hypothetical protein
MSVRDLVRKMGSTSDPIFKIVAAGALAAVWVLSGTTFDAAKIKITTQHHQTYPFDTVRTWNWSPDGSGEVKLATTADADPERLRERVEPVLVPAIEREMKARGLEKVSASPDVLVNYYVLVTVGQSSQYMGQFLPSTPEWGVPIVMGGTTAVRAYPVGTVLIDMVAPSLKSVVWRGAAQAEVDLDKKPEERRVRLEQAVRDMLEKFPPKKK